MYDGTNLLTLLVLIPRKVTLPLFLYLFKFLNINEEILKALAIIKSAKEMLEYTGVDGIMIGRASIGNPYIFKQVRQYLTGKEVRKS